MPGLTTAKEKKGMQLKVKKEKHRFQAKAVVYSTLLVARSAGVLLY